MTNQPEQAVLLEERKLEEALAILYRAVSACQFYPQQHPALQDALQDGYQGWRRVEDDYRWQQPGLQLRKGGLWLAEQQLGAHNPAVVSLARLFAGHGLVNLRKTGVLSLDGFSQLCSYLATSPDIIATRGGLASIWQREPYATALELTAPQVLTGHPGSTPGRHRARPNQEWGAGLPENETGMLAADSLLLRRLQSFQQKSPRERAVVELLLGLGRTDDMAAFLDRLRQIGRFVEEYLEMQRYREAYSVVLFLYREAQNMDALGKEGKRDYLLDTLSLLLRGDFLLWLINHVCSARGDEEAEVGEYILRALGKGAVVALINALCAENSRIARRRLVNVLVGIGEPAVPWAVKMLDDQRWFVVRNMVTVLGGVGSAEAVKALLRLSSDGDGRIRKEVARALGRSPSPDAEQPLLSLLDDRDPGVRRMAISSCATHRSATTLAALWRVFDRTRIGRAEWEMKISVLQAVTRLAMPDAYPRLRAVLRKKHLLQAERWVQVKCAALQALGTLGGEQAAALLHQFKEHSNAELRTTAARALKQFETKFSGAHQ